MPLPWVLSTRFRIPTWSLALILPMIFKPLSKNWKSTVDEGQKRVKKIDKAGKERISLKDFWSFKEQEMDEIIAIFKESADTKIRFAQDNVAKIEEVVQVVVTAFRSGKKLLIFGNGGSAADAQHIAAEFVNRYKLERDPLPALALTTDTSILTSISNDTSFDDVFARQIAALGQAGDIAWGITTSGTSPNIIRAFETARKLGLITLGFTGKEGGEVASLVDYNLQVASPSTPRIQETQLTLAHVICELVEKRIAK